MAATDPMSSMATAVVLWMLLPVIVLIQAAVLHRAGWRPFRNAFTDAALAVMSIAVLVYPIAPLYGRTGALVATLVVPILVGAPVLLMAMRNRYRAVRFGWRRVLTAVLVANLASFVVVGPVVAWGTRPLPDCGPDRAVECAAVVSGATGSITP